MKKCPRCLKYDNDTTRFCKHCGTELFFEERFGTNQSKVFSTNSIFVNSINLHYTKTGQGSPIILLHGNGEDHTIFNVLTKQLSPNYTVYALDSRGHGQSSKVKNLDYRDMMEDVASFIQALNIEKPILYGFSDGGIIGLLLAIKYPKIFSKLIVSGVNTHPTGIKTKYLLVMKIVYFFTRSRMYKLMLTQPNISNAELNGIITPTFILAGSNEFTKDEHTKMVAENIPNSILQVLEDENHASYVINNEKLYEIIKPYLEVCEK